MAQCYDDPFIEKVLNIRKDIVDYVEDRSYITMAAMSNDAVFGGVPLVCFGSAPVKSCELDPIPTWLLKQLMST